MCDIEFGIERNWKTMIRTIKVFPMGGERKRMCAIFSFIFLGTFQTYSLFWNVRIEKSINQTLDSSCCISFQCHMFFKNKFIGMDWTENWMKRKGIGREMK